MEKSELKKLVGRREKINKSGVRKAYDEAKRLFPDLDIKKTPHHDLLLTSKGRELITLNGNNSYLENQLIMFLTGMIAGYYEK